MSWTGGVGSETAQMWIRQLKKKKSKFKDSRVRDLNETRAILYSHLMRTAAATLRPLWLQSWADQYCDN